MAVAPSVPGSAEETIRFHQEVETELERICISQYFHSSRRSCEFLRYVVQATLDGRADSLKERTIGMDLLGRKASYDPGSDATVRVRANDVRKRLASYYGSTPHPGALKIILPTGTYIPSFVPVSATNDVLSSEVAASQIARKPAVGEGRSGLSWNRLWGIGLVLVMLLGCSLLVRQRLENQNVYQRFWKRIFDGKSVILFSMTQEDRDHLGPGLYPLVWVSGRFGVPIVTTSGSLTGATTATFAKARISSAPPANWQTDTRLHWLLDGRGTPTLSVRQPRKPAAISIAPHAALLTILPESPSILYVQSTDDDALRKIFEELTEKKSFPGGIKVPAFGSMELQILLTVDAMGHSVISVWEPQA